MWHLLFHEADYLEERFTLLRQLNDQKRRLATSGANFARAYTVRFVTCEFPENFAGRQDLSPSKSECHSFISGDLELKCPGKKDKYNKCGSDVFRKG